MKNKKTNLLPQFPNIFRFIPEKPILKRFYKSNQLMFVFMFTSILISAILFFGIIVLCLRLYQDTQILSKLIKDRQLLASKVNFWNSVTERFPGYKDAYFQIAILEYKLNNINMSKKANNEALLLDPNFKDAQNLKGLLNK